MYGDYLAHCLGLDRLASVVGISISVDLVAGKEKQVFA